MCQRVQLAGDQFDEGGLAAAVGSQQRGVLALRDAQAEIVQYPHLAADDAGPVQFDQRGGGRDGRQGRSDGHECGGDAHEGGKQLNDYAKIASDG